MIGPPPACWFCEHFHDPAKGWVCDAYPDGIPDAILRKGVDHFVPRPGDHGIQFSARDPRWKKEAERRWREDREAVEWFRQNAPAR